MQPVCGPPALHPSGGLFWPIVNRQANNDLVPGHDSQLLSVNLARPRLATSHPPLQACQSPVASPAASNSTLTILMVMCAAMDTATLRLRHAIHVVGRNPRKIAGYRHGEKKW
jgi:hypothetical protein